MCKTISNPAPFIHLMSDEIRFIDDPETMKVAIDPTRRKILELLRFNDLTVSQMVDVLGKDQSTIYRHVEKLLKAGFIEQSGERKEHHIPEKVYGRTARMFFLAPGYGAVSNEEVIAQHRTEMAQKTFRLMKKIGYESTDASDGASKELYTHIEALVQSKIKQLGPDQDLDFEMMRRLRTAIIIIEMQKDPKLRELAEKYAGSFI